MRQTNSCQNIVRSSQLLIDGCFFICLPAIPADGDAKRVLKIVANTLQSPQSNYVLKDELMN